MDSLVQFSHAEISLEQPRCFLLLNAAVEKELYRQYTEVVVSPPETRLGQYSKEEQQFKTTSSLIPSSCGTCKHYCTKRERQQTGKLVCYPSMNFQAMKRRLLYLLTLVLKGLKSPYWKQDSSCDWLIWRVLMQFLPIFAKIVNWKFVWSNFLKTSQPVCEELGNRCRFLSPL